jgi:hypothetical protein
VRAESVTACAANGFCYCVNKDLQDAVERNVVRIKQRIAKARALGKAIGYLSIPLSTIGGSYMGVNTKVAELAAKGIEERFGLGAVWMLNPGSKDYALPDAARGAEYMLMWTKILEGDSGLGQDFDFVYFTGPSDFARFFSLRGHNDMRRIEEYYDKHAKSDPELAKINKATFRNYYALRASVSFSYGSHDEWNIVRAVNQKRRDANEKSGMPAQLGVMFDGHAAAPGLFDTEVAAGNAGACRSGSN